MGRYSGTLANLVEEAIVAGKSHKGGKSSSHATTMWNKVLTYLENHSTQDGAIERPEFESPLPPFTVPSEILDEQLLERRFGPRQDNTILSLAVTCAPSHVVAALCHLQPHAARIPDHREKLPLHVACRRNPTDPDTLKVFDILLAVYEEGLAHRDSAGRTPLHCLFMYNHAFARSTQVVQLFCQALPPQLIANLQQPDPEGHKEDPHPLPEVPNPTNPKDKIPSNAAIIPDARHGALPLHYAVMEGASRDVLKLLLQVYPDSKRLVDRKGRTALAWYLGAGHDEDGRLVTGEPNDPNVTSWWDKHKLESATVQLLLNSKSARMADATGRSPLHWAVATLARHYYQYPHKSGAVCVCRKTIQCLLDHHVESLVTGDLDNKTPLHCLFDAVRDVQAAEWKRMQRNKVQRYHQQPNLDLLHGGPTGGFSPPLELLEVLVKNPEAEGDRSAVFMEDKDGRLPIHAAMEVASSAEVIQLLIKAHPTSLVHTTEETLLSPLHCAVMSPYVAPLQSAESIRLILRAYVASRHGTYVDGRLALKMEDADGNYPIHYACRNQACLEVLKMFVEEYPKCALFPTVDGELPLHCLLDSSHVFEAASDGTPPVGATLATSKAWESPDEERFHQQQLSVLQRKIQLLIDSLLASKRVSQLLAVPSFEHGLLPLHMAVAWGAVPYPTTYRMIQKYPQAAATYTTATDHMYSPLQLHEKYRQDVLLQSSTTCEAKEEQEWQHIRELLFSYSTTLDGHRNLDDLISQCVRSVRAEVCNGSSYHKTLAAHLKTLPEIPAIETTDTFTSVEVPDIDHGGRPLTKKAIERSRQPSPVKKRVHNRRKHKLEQSKSKKGTSSPKKSIYDDDAVEVGYEITSDGSIGNCDDEEDYFSGPEEAEEYMSDESDRRFDTFDDDEVDDPTMSTTEGSWITKTESGSQNNKDSSKHAGKHSRFQEEKKDDTEQPSSVHHDNTFLRDAKAPCLSDVVMRLLTFMVLYCDPKNPSDNYVHQVESIFDDVSRVIVEQIVSLPLSEYAAQYLEEGTKVMGLSLRDAASPKCRELFHRMFYFLGRFDFRSDTSGILLNRSTDGTTVQVRATEWTFSTEEYKEAPELEPGEAEAQVWETGIIPPDEVGYMGATFHAKRRNVSFVFTKNAYAYEKEVRCRDDLRVSTTGGALSSSHIVPLIDHFNANGLDRRLDRMYKNDTNNESFVLLDIFGGNGKVSSGQSICLAEYPYALVYPYSKYGDLYDFSFRHGVSGLEETREVCCQIGKSLKSMHEQGIVHGNVSMRNVILFPPVDDIEEDGQKHWALSNLSGVYYLRDRNSYMGQINSEGLAAFSTSTLPPEMFVKLTSSELKEYNDYWNAVEQTFNISVDRSVVDPVVDYQSGASFVVRCHFVASEADTEVADDKLPPLPYKLLPAREYSDIWAFGQLLFMLCSSGRQLFQTNARSGHLLGYKDVCLWDMQAAEAMVYEHVEHALAQDILLRLLSPYERRAALSMECVLNHPFFKVQDTTSSIVQSIVEKRRHASEAYRRWVENNVCEKSEEGWLKERTVAISCWDFDFQTRIHLTPTAIIPELLSRPQEDLGMPCSFVVLPYKLVRNKRGVLTPPSKRDVERAERLGLKMLALSKACHFVQRLKQVVEEEGGSVRWTTAALWPCMRLPNQEFSDLQSRMSALAAEHVEKFRQNPVSVGIELIKEKVEGFLECYDDSSRILLYLVDEFTGVPIAGASAAPFPHQVPSKASREVIQRALPFMYLCARYFRGVSGSAAGLVKLIFEAAAPHIPPSWTAVCKGLDNSLDRKAIIGDVRMLCEALCSMFDTRYGVAIDDDFEYMQNYISEIDIQRRFAKLQRVSSGEASVWTSSTGVEEIRDKAKKFTFRDAVDMKQQADLKLKEQETRIKELEKEVEKLRFRKDLQLDVPEMESFQALPAAASDQEVTEPKLDAYEIASKCIAANADLIDMAGKATAHETTEVAKDQTDQEVEKESDDTCIVPDESAPETSTPGDKEEEEEAIVQDSISAQPSTQTSPFSMAEEILATESRQLEAREKPTLGSVSPEPVNAARSLAVDPTPRTGSRLVDILKNVSSTPRSEASSSTKDGWNGKNSAMSVDTSTATLDASKGSKEWNDILTPE